MRVNAEHNACLAATGADVGGLIWWKWWVGSPSLTMTMRQEKKTLKMISTWHTNRVKVIELPGLR